MASSGRDHEMAEATAGAEASGDFPANEDEAEEKLNGVINVLPGSTESAASFEFRGEDHTLGNALRHIIMKNPDVEFCGYTIPHPAENKMHLRIQTYDNVNVHDVLEKGLNNLMDLCDVVVDKFESASKDYHAKRTGS